MSRRCNAFWFGPARNTDDRHRQRCNSHRAAQHSNFDYPAHAGNVTAIHSQALVVPGIGHCSDGGGRKGAMKPLQRAKVITRSVRAYDTERVRTVVREGLHELGNEVQQVRVPPKHERRAPRLHLRPGPDRAAPSSSERRTSSATTSASCATSGTSTSPARSHSSSSPAASAPTSSTFGTTLPPTRHARFRSKTESSKPPRTPSPAA